MRYRRKSAVSRLITFDEFVQYGKDHGGNMVDGMPWSFEFEGQPVTHMDDRCYCIVTPLCEVLFTEADVLTIDDGGNIYPVRKTFFKNVYELV